MCTSTALIATSLLSTLGSAAQSVSSQRQSQRAQIEANRRETARRQAEAIAQFGALQADRVEARRRTSEEIAGQRDQERRARARARTARGEAGVSGLSVRAQERDIAGAGARAREAALAGLRADEAAIERRKDAVHRGAEAALAGLSRPPSVDYFRPGLQVAQGVTGAGAALRRRSAPEPGNG